MKLTEIAVKEDPLLKKTAERIEDVLYDINKVYRKDAGADFDLFRRIDTTFTSEKTAAVIAFVNSNATDSQEEAFASVEVIRDALEEEGLINGTLPVDIRVGKSAFERDAVTIQLSRQK